LGPRPTIAAVSPNLPIGSAEVRAMPTSPNGWRAGGVSGVPRAPDVDRRARRRRHVRRRRRSSRGGVGLLADAGHVGDRHDDHASRDQLDRVADGRHLLDDEAAILAAVRQLDHVEHGLRRDVDRQRRWLGACRGGAKAQRAQDAQEQRDGAHRATVRAARRPTTGGDGRNATWAPGRARRAGRCGASRRPPCDSFRGLVRVLFVASEMAPYAKTGGLADVMGALPARVARAMGTTFACCMPLYDKHRHVDPATISAWCAEHVPAALGAHAYASRSSRVGDSRCMYFVHCPALYARGLAVHERRRTSTAASWRCVTSPSMTCQQQAFAPEVVQCNDWQAALVPLILKTRFATDRHFAGARTLLTIHNLNYQGSFPSSVLARH
jgi:hypothetical protein